MAKPPYLFVMTSAGIIFQLQKIGMPFGKNWHRLW